MGHVISAGSVVPPPSGRPPQHNLAPRDVETLADELVAYHAYFAPLFQRSEQRQWALAYLHGQLLELERKSIEAMALALEGGDVQGMQQFISDGPWDDERILEKHQDLVAETLGDAATGVLILDGCDFPKQGTYSVGVARQWCGALGKGANCQASVVACYASKHGYTLVDRRLYLHKNWFSEEYRARWERCGIPEGTPFQTRPQVAAELVTSLQRRGVLPVQWVACDEQFGDQPELLDQIARLGLFYLAEVPHDTHVWQERPPTAVPARGKRGPAPRRERVQADAPPSVRVDTLAGQVAPNRWQRYQLKEGAKGPLVAEFAFLRVVQVRNALPGDESWLVLRRSLGEKPELKSYVSNAPATTRHSKLVWVSGMRWPVESAIEESKGEVGLDQYEVRGWVGWHHHTALSFLAHHVLVWQRCRMGKKISGVDGGARARVAAGGLTAQAAGCRNGDWAHRVHPRAELRGLPFPSEEDRGPPRHILTNSRCNTSITTTLFGVQPAGA
jgi:SRSO17 transposase